LIQQGDVATKSCCAKGYAVTGVRDRDAIADWLPLARDKPEHPERS
jgi:hypothetical protein